MQISTITHHYMNEKSRLRCYFSLILKIGWQKQKLCPKIFLNRESSVEKWPVGEVIIFPENFKNLNILS